MRDIQLSSDGDLVLGQQAVDEEGYLLYYEDNSNNNEPPRVTREPSERTRPIRDLSEVYRDDFDKQLIHTRVRTENPDWSLYRNIGANLSDLVGQLNNPATAEAGEEMIKESITRGGYFSDEEVFVEGIPVGPNELFFDIQLRRPYGLIRYGLEFNFDMGVQNIYEVGE